VSLTYADVGNIDTSNNTNLAAVFLAAARWIEDGVGHFPAKGPLTIVGLDKWDTSKVTDMNNLFALAQIQSLGDVSGWDTSNVTNMAWTFGEIIYSSDSIIDISNWNVDKVTEWGYFNHHNETKIIPPVKFNN
jgi:surface protein